VSVVSFADRVTVESPLSPDLSQAVSAISRLQARGNTALYDAVGTSAALTAAGTGRRAVVLLTDGEEYGGLSKLTREQSLAAAAASHTLFYVIGLGSEADIQYLRQLAQSTGGQYFDAPQPEDVPAVYRAIQDQLRSYYLVSLQSSAAADASDRQVTISVATATGSASATLRYLSRRPARAAQPAAAAAEQPTETAVQPAPPVSAKSKGALEPTTIVIAIVVVALPVILGASLLLSARKRRAVSVADDVRAEPRHSAPLTAVHQTGLPAVRLVEVREPGKPARRLALPGVLVIGSADDCDVVLSGTGVAPHHARLWVRDDNIMLHSLSDSHRTEVGGTPVQWVSVPPGGEILIGGVVIQVEPTHGDPPREVADPHQHANGSEVRG
jgi:hypothetical protein